MHQSTSAWPAETKMFMSRPMPDSVLQQQPLPQRIVQYLDGHIGQSFMASDLHAVIDSRASESDAVNNALSQLKKVGRIKAYRDPSISNKFFFYTSVKSANPTYAPVPKATPKPAPAVAPAPAAASTPAPAPAPAPMAVATATVEPKPIAATDLNTAVMALIEQRALGMAEKLAETMLNDRRKAAHAEMQDAIDQFAGAMSAIAKRYFGE